MNDATGERAALAEKIARAAGDLALDFFSRRDELTVEANAPDIVSRADREVGALIRARVAEAFPVAAHQFSPQRIPAPASSDGGSG